MDDHKKYFLRFIQSYYPETAEDILAATEQHFSIISKDIAFVKTSENPLDKRLDFSGYFLAFIKTLDEKGETYDNIRKICLEITTAYVQPKSKVEEFVKQLVPRLIATWVGQRVVKSFQKKISGKASADGFVVTIITDKTKTYGLGYGLDIIECGICKLFGKHNYSHYVPILCEVDKITSGFAGLELIRTGTIANGGEKCDFRFKRKQGNQ
jgi:hypothetical protein